MTDPDGDGSEWNAGMRMISWIKCQSGRLAGDGTRG